MFRAAVRYNNGTCKISEMVKQKIVGIFLFLSSTLHAFGNLLHFPPPSPPSTTTFIFNDDYWMVVCECKMNDNFYFLHDYYISFLTQVQDIYESRFHFTWYPMHININCYEAFRIILIIPRLHPIQPWSEFVFLNHFSFAYLFKAGGW